MAKHNERLAKWHAAKQAKSAPETSSKTNLSLNHAQRAKLEHEKRQQEAKKRSKELTGRTSNSNHELTSNIERQNRNARDIAAKKAKSFEDNSGEIPTAANLAKSPPGYDLFGETSASLSSETPAGGFDAANSFVDFGENDSLFGGEARANGRISPIQPP